MFAAIESWQELLCFSVLAYTGIRRAAAAGLRWREVDLASGTVRVGKRGARSRPSRSRMNCWRF